MIKQYKLRFYNFRLVTFLLAISFIGIQLVGTAADYLRTRQLLGVIIGVVFMLILSLMDYSWLLNFQWIMYGFNIVMLLAVRFFGSSANGAARWVDLGFIRFQPTELSKIIIILFFAKFFMDHEEDLNTLKTLIQSAVLLVIPLMLIYVQPDMKNTITVTVLFCILIYIAGLSYKIIGGVALIAIPLAIIFLSLFEPVPDPADKFGHGRHGARNDVVETLFEGLDPHAAGRQVPQPERSGDPFDHRDLLADRIRGGEVCPGKEDRQRHGRESAAAPHVENPRSVAERADLGDGQRMQHVTQVELVEILARNDVDLRVPVGIEVVQRRELLLLTPGQVREIFNYQLQL